VRDAVNWLYIRVQNARKMFVLSPSVLSVSDGFTAETTRTEKQCQVDIPLSPSIEFTALRLQIHS